MEKIGKMDISIMCSTWCMRCLEIKKKVYAEVICAGAGLCLDCFCKLRGLKKEELNDGR